MKYLVMYTTQTTVAKEKNLIPRKTVKLKFIDEYWKVLRDIIVVADI